MGTKRTRSLLGGCAYKNIISYFYSISRVVIADWSLSLGTGDEQPSKSAVPVSEKERCEWVEDKNENADRFISSRWRYLGHIDYLISESGAS